MRKLLFISCIAFMAGFLSCTKDVVEDGVLLRVKNKTNDNFSSVVTSDTEFGTIKANSISGCKRVEKIVENPTAFMVKDGNTVLCGVYYLAYIGYIENGKYTLEITTDETRFFGYGCRYIKE